MSPAAWEVLELVLAVLFMAGFFYYYVAGVHFEDRAMSRLAALAFLCSAVVERPTGLGLGPPRRGTRSGLGRMGVYKRSRMAFVRASWPSSEDSRLRAIASRWMSWSG